MQLSQLIALGAALSIAVVTGARIKNKAVELEQSVEHEKEGPFEMEETREEVLKEQLHRSKRPDDYREIYTNFQCSRDNKEMCPMCKYARKTAKCEAYREGDKVDDTFPIRIARPEHGLPEELQGVVWLTDQKGSSALVSFAPSEDGGGLSELNEKGVGKVRVSGDRVWSFSDSGREFDASEKADLIYTFAFNNKTAPRKAQIYPKAANYHISLGRYAEWLLDFEMDLLQCPKDLKTSDNPFCRDMPPEFQDSIVWQRRSYLLGKDGRLPHATYKAVQVIKGDGTKLPAFYKWIDFCSQPESGTTPEEFHYHEVDNSKKCFKKKSWFCRRLGICR